MRNQSGLRRFVKACLVLACFIFCRPSFAQISVEAADDLFFDKIQRVAEGFKQAEQEHGQFPRYFMYGGGEMAEIVQKELEGKKENPYYRDRNVLVYPKLLHITPRYVEFSFLTDDKLSEEQMDIYKDDPPSGWHGAPGIIGACGNSAGTWMVLFGTGADGLALRERNQDGTKGPLRYILLHHEK